MLNLAITDVAAYIAFAVVILAFASMLALSVMLVFLTSLIVWRWSCWFARSSWNQLIMSLERKAFR